MERVRLEDVSERGSSNLAQKDIEGAAGEYPVYGASGYIGSAGFYHQEKAYVAVVKDGAGVGRTMLLPGRSSVIGTLQYIIPKENILPEYLYYAVKNMKLARYYTGATIPHIYYKDYKKEVFWLPDLAEQRRVVGILENVGKIIDEQQQELLELDQLIQSRFREMFGDPVKNEKGFPVYKMCDIVEFQGGSQPDKTCFEYEPTEDNIRLIQIRDYKTDKYITYIPKEKARRFCTADDIMIGRYGPPIFQILQGIEGAYNVALMKAVPQRGRKEFIRQFLKQDCLLYYLEGMAKRTAGQDGIQMDRLKEYPFPLPQESLQISFETFKLQLDKWKAEGQQQLEKIQILFDSLMQQYFG